MKYFIWKNPDDNYSILNRIVKEHTLIDYEIVHSTKTEGGYSPGQTSVTNYDQIIILNEIEAENLILSWL